MYVQMVPDTLGKSITNEVLELFDWFVIHDNQSGIWIRTLIAVKPE